MFQLEEKYFVQVGYNLVRCLVWVVVLVLKNNYVLCRMMMRCVII